MNNVVLKGKLGAGFNDDRYTLPKDGNPGDILVRTETGSAWQKQEPATSTPDWNQNDPTARDYIKNRPCYRTTGRISLLNNAEFNFNEDRGIFVSMLEPPINIAEGNKCFITWDGVEYECVSGYKCVGNLAIIGGGEDTGEPFIILDELIATLDTSQSHVLKFDMLVYDYSKLAAEYVENGLVLKRIIYHDKPEITREEFEKYNRIKPIMLCWNGKWFDDVSSDGGTPPKMICSHAGERIIISINADNVYLMKNYKKVSLSIASVIGGIISTAKLELDENMATVWPRFFSSGNSSTDTIFKVKKNGSKSGMDFEVLGDGSIKTNYVIIGSSTPNSTKKFKITVDDTGTISATEVT